MLGFKPLPAFTILLVFGSVFYLGLALIFKKDEYLEFKRLLLQR
jgi:hypothetical protein